MQTEVKSARFVFREKVVKTTEFLFTKFADGWTAERIAEELEAGNLQHHWTANIITDLQNGGETVAELAEECDWEDSEDEELSVEFDD